MFLDCLYIYIGLPPSEEESKLAEKTPNTTQSWGWGLGSRTKESPIPPE